MGTVLIFPLEKTKLYKLAKEFANLVLSNKIYEANLFALYKIPDQLKPQVKQIATFLIKNGK